MQPEDAQKSTETEIQGVFMLTEKYQFSNIGELSALFEPLQVCLGWRTLEEWENFKFCLCQFLNNVDTLYRVMLPELTAYTTQRLKQTSKSESRRECRYIWTCLRSIVRLLEQTEPFCQLINSFVYRRLEELDGDSDGEMGPEAPGRDGNTRRWRPDSGQAEWEQEHSVLLELLAAWQRYQNRCQIFIVQFVDFVNDIPGLAQTDSAFKLLLDHACSIFGSILPDFHSSDIESDEIIAALLLNMMQKVDLLLWQIDILLQVLHPLVKLYAITAGMY
jgi:hypothetical protein